MRHYQKEFMLVFSMVCLIDPYRCTDQPSVRYILNHINVSRHGTLEHTNKSICTARTNLLLDRYILLILGGMLRYGEPWVLVLAYLIIDEFIKPLDIFGPFLHKATILRLDSPMNS